MLLKDRSSDDIDPWLVVGRHHGESGSKEERGDLKDTLKCISKENYFNL